MDKNFSFYTINLEENPYITKPLTTEQLRTASLLKFDILSSFEIYSNWSLNIGTRFSPGTS